MLRAQLQAAFFSKPALFLALLTYSPATLTTFSNTRPRPLSALPTSSKIIPGMLLIQLNAFLIIPHRPPALLTTRLIFSQIPLTQSMIGLKMLVIGFTILSLIKFQTGLKILFLIMLIRA